MFTNSTTALRPVVRKSGATALAVLLGCTIAATAAQASPGQSTTTLRNTTAAALAAQITGNGVTVTDAKVTGKDVQAGSYSGLQLGLPGFESGVALSTGSLVDSDPDADSDTDFTVSSLLGPNRTLTGTGDFGTDGNKELEKGNGGKTTYDAASLSFTVTPDSDSIELSYVLGSEEFGKWESKGYADSLGILVNGSNCALVPSPAGPVQVSALTVNASTNPELYSSNAKNAEGNFPFDTNFNGFTKALKCTAKVTPNAANTVSISIADTVDGQLDSTVLLAPKSLNSVAAKASDKSVADRPHEDAVNVVPAGQVSDGKSDNKQAAAVENPGSLANTGAPELLVPIVLAVSAGILGGAAVMFVKRRRRLAK
jgi:hypothetical protein